MNSVTGAGQSVSGDAPRAVIAGHGEFAAGIVSAVQQITGMGSVFSAVTSIGLTSADIEAALAQALDAAGARV
ncbi:MAG: hypothetical protein ABI120_05835, partial [Gemmatimonadaceae bacterium]